MYHLTMTPAERASAVAFALKNCALEAMTPGDATMRAAAGYERGDNDVSALIDTADRETSGIVSGRLADGSLDDHATDHASSVFARTVLLAERRWNPSGDIAELIAIHRGLFDGVFSDAGQLRTSNVTREVTDKRHQAKNPEAFFPAQLIETGALEHLDRACRQTQPGQPRPGRVRPGARPRLRRTGLPAPVQGRQRHDASHLRVPSRA